MYYSWSIIPLQPVALSSFLHLYGAIDERCIQLGVIFRHWAKVHTCTCIPIHIQRKVHTCMHMYSMCMYCTCTPVPRHPPPQNSPHLYSPPLPSSPSPSSPLHVHVCIHHCRYVELTSKRKVTIPHTCSW